MPTPVSGKQWAKDPIAETVMRDLGLKPKLADIPIEDIDWEEIEKNLGRTGREISTDTVEDYALQMMDGAVFPRPIGVWTKSGWLIPAGVHRVSAAREAGMTTVGIYVVTVALESELRQLALMTNRMQGMRIPRAEALRQAVFMVTSDGLVLDDVCRRLGVKKHTVQEKLMIQKTADRLLALGFRHKFPDTCYMCLHTLIGNDKVFLAAAKLASSRKMTADSLREMTKAIRAEKTEALQLALIDREEASAREIQEPPPRADGSRVTTVLHYRSKLLASISTLERLLVTSKAKKVSDLQIVEGSDEHKQIKRRWVALRADLNKVLG